MEASIPRQNGTESLIVGAVFIPDWIKTRSPKASQRIAVLGGRRGDFNFAVRAMSFLLSIEFHSEPERLSSIAPIDRMRRLIPERLVKTLPVVESEILVQTRPAVPQTGVIVEIDLFILDGSPQAFDEDIIKDPSAAIHADLYPRGEEPISKHRAGELAALIAVEDGWLGQAQRGV